MTASQGTARTINDPPMSRSAWFRASAIAAIAVAAAVSVVWPSVNPLLFFALLVAVAGRLRIEDDDPSSAGFEAAVIFAAVALLHTPLVALFAVLTFFFSSRRRHT